MKKFIFCLSALAATAAVSAQTKWDLPTGYSANSFQTQNVQQFANEVDQLTGGKLKITLHPGGSLYKANEIKRAVQTGQVQVGDVLISVLGNEDPIFEVDAVPLLARDFDSAWKLWQASRATMESRLAKQGIKLLYSVPWPPQGIYTKVPVKQMADFKSMKFRAYNAATSRMVELMGASPTTVSSGDVPQAFGTGLIEAMITSPATGVDSQAWDFSKYYYDVQAFIPKNVTMVNARAFNQLSPASQKAVLAAAERAEKKGWETARKQTSELTEKLAKNGMVVGPTPPAIDTDLGKVGATMAAEWLKKAGADGKAVLDQAKR